MARKLDPAKSTAILNAARMVLLRDGYSAAKMSDIAGEAGVAPGTLYLYFDSKEALASAIGEDFFARLGSEFAQVVKKLDKPSGVNVLVDWAVQIATQERDLLSLLKQQGGENARQGEPGPKKAFRRLLTDSLKTLMERRHVRQYDAESLSHVVMSVLGGIFQSCLCADLALEIEPIKTASVRVLQHALFEDGVMAETRQPKSEQAKDPPAKTKTRQSGVSHRR